MDQTSQPGVQSSITELVNQFANRDGQMRQAARERLVEIGAPAVPALIEALSSATEQVRWEAAKALTEIPDARAADALVGRFKDSFSIRWLAATALINLGEAALIPLVHGLMAAPDSPRVRESAGHVLRELKRAFPENRDIPALLDALSGQAQTETIPWVGRGILRKMGLLPLNNAPVIIKR